MKPVGPDGALPHYTKKKPSAGAYPVMKLMGPDGALPHYTREELDVAPTTTPHPVIPRLRPSSSLMAEKKPSAGAYPVMKPVGPDRRKKKPSAGAYPVMKPCDEVIMVVGAVGVLVVGERGADCCICEDVHKWDQGQRQGAADGEFNAVLMGGERCGAVR
ncbi:unnamed protein product [Closterium sp. NIES-64]|nr:unnamed protein product [Closterium sp. NIES-64]